jgi:hypothetical protein
LAEALKATPTPKDTNLGPNEKYPFGIKITDAKGNISWERYATATDRDKRLSLVKGGLGVNYGQPKPAAAEPAKPAAKPAAAAEPAKPAAKPAAAAKPKTDEMALHLNKTGRLCFGKEATAYLGDKRPAHMALAIDGKTVRLKPAKSEGDDTCRMGDAAGRPYISAMREFRKAFGFDGAQSLDFTAKPYQGGGLEFRWIA